MRLIRGKKTPTWLDTFLRRMKPENRQAFHAYISTASKNRTPSEQEFFRTIARRYRQVNVWFFFQLLLLAPFIVEYFFEWLHLSFFNVCNELCSVYVFVVLFAIIIGNTYIFFSYRRESVPYGTFQDSDGNAVTALHAELRFGSPWPLGDWLYESLWLRMFDTHNYLFFLQEGLCYGYFDAKRIVIPYDDIEVCGDILRCPHGDIWLYIFHGHKGKSYCGEMLASRGATVKTPLTQQDFLTAPIHLSRSVSIAVITLLLGTALILFLRTI